MKSYGGPPIENLKNLQFIFIFKVVPHNILPQKMKRYTEKLQLQLRDSVLKQSQQIDLSGVCGHVSSFFFHFNFHDMSALQSAVSSTVFNRFLPFNV